MSRFSVDFTADADEQIREIQASIGASSKAEVIRKALGLLSYIEKERAAGGRVIIENSSTSTRTEVVGF